MTPPTPTQRSYDSTRRRARAQESRARILDAARALFVESGYAATTLASIAERADVALPTLYAAFGSKGKLLATLLDERPGEPETQVQILTADQLAEIKALPDAEAKLDLFASLVAAHLERWCDLLVALRVAGCVEGEAATIEVKRRDDEYALIRQLGQHLRSSGLLKADLSAATATDTLWALSDVQLFTMLVRTRGWRLSRYRSWLADSLTAVLVG